MGYNEDLNSNNADLRNILDLVLDLPTVTRYVYKWQEYHNGYTLTSSGNVKESTDQNRRITDLIYVNPGQKYKFENLSAKYGNSMIVVYDSSGKMVLHIGTEPDSLGVVLSSIEIMMPPSADRIRMACDLGVSSDLFRFYYDESGGDRDGS